MAAPSEFLSSETDHYRREAMGAFAHEIRTPLTSIRMVIEQAKRLGSGDQSILDAELSTMLNTSIDDLQRLADDLQEISRLERGKSTLAPGPCDLRAAVAAARELVTPGIELIGPNPPSITGPWDAGHLVRALAGFAQAANRIGAGSGAVDLVFEEEQDGVRLRFASGSFAGEEKPVAADAGFAFFRARQFVLAMGGEVTTRRRERAVEIAVGLPLKERYTA
ncbi:sensor histidine kinase [bacterium]|nr:MAG: sensor histidine kinase [bacterium]